MEAVLQTAVLSNATTAELHYFYLLVLRFHLQLLHQTHIKWIAAVGVTLLTVGPFKYCIIQPSSFRFDWCYLSAIVYLMVEPARCALATY